MNHHETASPPLYPHAAARRLRGAQTVRAGGALPATPRGAQHQQSRSNPYKSSLYGSRGWPRGRAGCWDRERLNRRSGQSVIYRAMGGPRYGDLRDWPAIALWAKDIAAQLKIQAPAEPERQSGPTVVL